MGNVAGFDAAFCPDPVPVNVAGLDVAWCEVYVGGSSATRPDGWDSAEVALVAHLPKLPVWVPTPGIDNPRQAALGAVAALRRYKVPAFAHPYRALMVDLETGQEPDPAWLASFRAVILGNGYDTMPYGSASWIFGYPAYSGYVVADPDQIGAPHLYPHAGVAGTQFRWSVSTRGGVVDADLLEASLMPHLGMWG